MIYKPLRGRHRSSTANVCLRSYTVPEYTALMRQLPDTGAVSALGQSAPTDDDGSDRRDDNDDQRNRAGDHEHIAVKIAAETVLRSAAVLAPVCNNMSTTDIGYTHRRRRRGAGGTFPQKNRENIFRAKII